MPYSSLEDFIKAADAIGEVEYVEGADLELDVGCLTGLLGERGGPMPVFNKIPGYPAGYRVCSNTVKSMRRFCLALDLPLDIHPLELLRLRQGEDYYVTVDEDIDPTNLNEVLWAMCTRVDPATSIDIIRDAWTADLDPRVSPARREAGELTVGRMLINACRPFIWRDQFPKSNVFSSEERKIVETKWRDLLEKAARKRSA